MDLEKLRDLRTPSSEFRDQSIKIFNYLARETQKEMEAAGVQLIVILRSGVTMLPSFLNLFTNAKVGFLGIQRDEKTAIPRIYYEKIPAFSIADNLIILDPMIATGGSMTVAIDHLKDRGGCESQIIVVGLICSTPGIENIRSRFPNVKINILVEDPELDQDKWIKPGLGDFGDRFFGT